MDIPLQFTVDDSWEAKNVTNTRKGTKQRTRNIKKEREGERGEE